MMPLRMIVHWFWRLLFYVVIPIACIDSVMAVRLLKNVIHRTKPKFDLWGFIISIIESGLGSLRHGFSEVNSKKYG